MEKNNTRHPEAKDDEVFMGNCMSSGDFDTMKYKTKRKGIIQNIATEHDIAIPLYFPVFIKKEEYDRCGCFTQLK